MEEQLEQLEKLKLRIPYDVDIFETKSKYETILTNLLEDSRNIALSEIYPYEDWYEMELPKKYLNWQIRACMELYNGAGKEGIVSYSENGLSWSRKTDSPLSLSLMEELMPRVAAPKKENNDE